MLLKNLMEDKQLDFNQPLLSVRRFSSTGGSGKDDKRKTDNSLSSIPPLPSYKSELKSGPVRNPGVVPFQWEQTPGRPKDEGKQQAQALERPHIAPKLPPGRILKLKQQTPDKVYEDPIVTNSQAEKVPSSSQSVSSIDENVTKSECSKDAMEEKESSDSEDGDEVYLDALDTLSRTESFFLNCSVSGLSGLDEPDAKPSGTFSMDPQTRDFMMGRFLPAAKAMTSETPQYASRKQPVAWEQPRVVKKVIGGNKKPPVYRYRPNMLPNYEKYNRDAESDDEVDYYETGNISAKVCGLLPRFCLKSPVSLLNPAPGMSVRTRVPISPATRKQTRSSSSGSCSGTENEHSQVAINEQRSIGGMLTADLCEDKSMLKNGSNQNAYPSNSQNLEGSSLYRRLQASGVSPYRNEFPQSPFSEEKGFLGINEEAKSGQVNGCNSQKKGPTSFRELLADQSMEWEIGSASPVVEKTLYIDSVHNVDSPNPNSNSFSSDKKGLPDSRENDLEIFAKTGRTKETSLVDSSVKDIENSNIVDEVILQPKILKPTDSGLLSFSDKSDQKLGMGILKAFGQDKDLHQESIISAKLPDNGNLDSEDQQPTKVENVENSHGSYSQFPLPPPPPKSPSESWLWRTLPSMSSRNPSSWSYLGTRTNTSNHAAKTTSVDPKWETIVKTTKVQRQHLRFSEELLTPVPET